MESEERPAKMRKLEHGDHVDGILDSGLSAAPTTIEEQNLVTVESSESAVVAGETSAVDTEEPGREDRKAKRKEKAKERKERKREAWKEQNADENGNVPKMPPSRLPRHFSGNGTQVPITIIFDCDFEDLMYDTELKSLGLQITRCYSDNRKAKYKTHLALSSFGGKMKERFDGILAKQYTSWKGFQFFGALRRPREDLGQGEEAPIDGAEEEGEIIYLSSESDNVLTHLKPNSTYIIGGLVDKNRHKGICHKRALNRNVKTAKLPIGEYLEMRDRKVLVTNHVLDILLKWMEYDDWGKAFMEVMPKRKGFKLREGGEPDEAGSNAGNDNGVEQDEEEMEDAAKEAVKEADGSTYVPEAEIIETTKGLPVGETEAE
jgi:tRNA (guanine9-N1)-methyltransferase